MSKIQLSEYAKAVGQEKAALALGVRQGAISKAIKTKRNIFVTVSPDGSVTAEETREFPSAKTKPKQP